MRDQRRLALALVLSLLCAGLLLVMGCSSSAPAGGESSGSAQLMGKPWVVSNRDGNLPDTAPSAKDDLYLHYAYDTLKEHQGTSFSPTAAAASELKDTVVGLIENEATTNHDLEQMRILIDQAADWDTLAQTGLSELQPYLDRIDAVSSMDELNALVADKSFPFNPFLVTAVASDSMQGHCLVSLMPNFLFMDSLLFGGEYYAEATTEEGKEVLYAVAGENYAGTMADFTELGMETDDINETLETLLDFETSYGKHLEYNSLYTDMDYGGFANELKKFYYSLDEASALCPNIPLREMLAKEGKDSFDRYSLGRGTWLSALNELWTQENLDTLKLMVTAQVMRETRFYRDPTTLNSLWEELGIDPYLPESFAWKAADSKDTFAQVIAKSYTDSVLGQTAKERCVQLTHSVVDSFEGLILTTPWMGDDAKAAAIDKLRHITLNVLEPADGWFDYSGLELVPSDKGGTLLSNYLLCKQYRIAREAELVGKPANASYLWYIIKPTIVNCLYDPQTNSINIMPGFVTSLMYQDGISDTELIAGLGFAIAHELNHGFDYLGSQTNEFGQPEPIFSEADLEAFLGKCTQISDYFSGIEVEPGRMYDGKNVVMEATADLGGFECMLATADKVENMDYALLFKKLSSAWADVIPADYMTAYYSDIHPLSYQRVNVNAQMSDELYATYDVAEGDGMYLAPDRRIHLWGAKA